MGTNVLRFAASAALVAAAAMTAVGSAAGQSVTTVEPAGYVVFPRVVSDPGDMFDAGSAANTVIQLTNTSNADVTVHCVYINATSTCSSGVNVAGSPGAECRDRDDCVGALATCDPQWSAADFTITLSPQQPTGWVASDGVAVPLPGDGVVPPVNLDYFVGELKCIHVDNATNANPVNANVLIGEATIYGATPDGIDVSAYNAIGIQTVATDGSTQSDKTMCLGGNGISGDVCEDGEYASCPAKLVLGHFFEGAIVGEGEASTELTLVPCSQDIVTLEPTSLVAQFLVFNEFEQRMSASTRVTCTETSPLADFGNIFNVSVQGTLSGQTHIRPVSAEGPLGLIGMAEEFIDGEGHAAYHLNSVGEGSADVVRYVFPATP